MVPFLGQDNCRPARHGGHRFEKKTRQLQHPKSSNQPFVSMSGRNIAHTNQPILRDSENRSSQKDLVGSWRGNDEMKYAGISGRSGPTCIGSPPQQPRSIKLKKHFLKDTRKEKVDILELLRLDLDMVIMHQWQLLNLLIEMLKQKELIKRKKTQQKKHQKLKKRNKQQHKF